jgi:hypothetical protein
MVARFFLVQNGILHTELYQKFTPNGHKIHKMAEKYQNGYRIYQNFLFQGHKSVPKFGFSSSGNPGFK